MDQALSRALEALSLALRLSLPACGAAFAVALAIALVQGVTRLHEPALNALPRALATLLILGVAGGFMARELVAFSHGLFQALPELVARP